CHTPTTHLYDVYFLLHSALPPRHLHPFPTRRSSDLPDPSPVPPADQRQTLRRARLRQRNRRNNGRRRCSRAPGTAAGPDTPKARSEEHTSELQSRFDLVCRLLLEKKNDKQCDSIRPL